MQQVPEPVQSPGLQPHSRARTSRVLGAPPRVGFTFAESEQPDICHQGKE